MDRMRWIWNGPADEEQDLEFKKFIYNRSAVPKRRTYQYQGLEFDVGEEMV